MKSMPNYKDGVKSLGVPIIPMGAFPGWYGTNVYFVDGTNGKDSYDGKSPTRAKKTIQAAITVAGSQDTIYIRTLAPDADASDPGQYVEDLTIPYAKHGLKVIGATPHIGPYAGPKVKNATATTLLDIFASAIVLENIQFNCTRNSGTYGLYLQGDAGGYTAKAGSVGLTMANCFIKNASASYGGIYINGGYGVTIHATEFQMCEKAIWIPGVVASNGHKIQNCDFKSNNGAAIAEHITIAAGLNADIVIKDSIFEMATSFLSCGAGNTGIIANCQFEDLVATLANSTGKVKVPAGTMSVVGCTGGLGLAVIQSQA